MAHRDFHFENRGYAVRTTAPPRKKSRLLRLLPCKRGRREFRGCETRPSKLHEVQLDSYSPSRLRRQPPRRGVSERQWRSATNRSPLPRPSVLDAPHRGAGPEAAAETCRRTATGGVRVKSRSSRFTRSKSPYESPGELPDCHSPLGGAEPRKSFLGSFFSKKLRPEKRKEVAPCALGTWKYRAGRPWPPWPG